MLKRTKLLNGLFILSSSAIINFYALQFIEKLGPREIIGLLILFIPILVLTIFTFGNILGLFYFLWLIFFIKRLIPFQELFFPFTLFLTTFISLLSKNSFQNSVKRYRKKIDYLRKRLSILNKEIEEKDVVRSALEERFDRLSQLRLIIEEFSTTFDLNEMLRFGGDMVLRIIPNADTAIIYLLGNKEIDSEFPRISLFSIKSKREIPGKLSLDEFDRWILTGKGNLIINDVQRDFRFSIESYYKTKRDFSSLLISLLASERKIFGAIRLESSLSESFSLHDLRMLDIFSEQMVVGIENILLYQRLEELAKRDSLTGVFLPRYLYEWLDKFLMETIEISFLMLDLDYFKDYNDRYGHIAGDIMLKKIAKIVLSEIPDKDIVVRYGGEEFLVVLMDCGKEKAIEHAERIRVKVEEEIFYLRREATRVTVSIGIATYPVDGKTKEELIHKADEQLYLAKSKGRNRIAFSLLK